jgi:hypothetical protein
MAHSPVNDSLPPELLIQVMSCLESPRDLYSLVVSSKHVYQIFHYSRVVVLAAVIKKALPHGNINLAVTACKAAAISRAWYAKTDCKTIEKQQEKFLVGRHGGHAPEPLLLHDYSLLISLYKLWWMLDYFMHLLEAKSLRVASRKLLQVQNAKRSMSEFEKYRIQRSFLTFEIYRRITPAHQNPDIRNELYDQTIEFLKSYQPWQREEILSVEEFLIETSKDVIRSAREYTYRQVSSVAHDLAAQPDTIMEPNPLQELGSLLELGGVDPFWHGFPPCARSLHYFASRGLPFMKWLLTISQSNQLHVVTLLTGERRAPSILECLRIGHDEMTLAGEAICEVRDEDTDPSENSIDGPSCGWKWAETHDLTDGKPNILKRYELRRMGYCFWDAQRLNEDWNFSELSPSELELTPRSQNDDGQTWLKEEPESGFKAYFEGLDVPVNALNIKFRNFIDRLEEGRDFDEDEIYPFPPPFSEQETKLFNFEY